MKAINLRKVLKVIGFVLLASAVVVSIGACGKKDKDARQTGYYGPGGGYLPPGGPGGPGGGSYVTRAVGQDDRYGNPSIVLELDIFDVSGNGALGQIGVQGQMYFPSYPYGCRGLQALGQGLSVSGTGTLISGMQIAQGPFGPITIYGRVTSSSRLDVTVNDGTGYCNAILN